MQIKATVIAYAGKSYAETFLQDEQFTYET